MKRFFLISALGLLAACEPGAVGPGPAVSGGGGMREFLVLGSSRMSFEQCRARGGLIIRDKGSAMVACDPRVRRKPVPADEFNHPDVQG